MQAIGELFGLVDAAYRRHQRGRTADVGVGGREVRRDACQFVVVEECGARNGGAGPRGTVESLGPPQFRIAEHDVDVGEAASDIGEQIPMRHLFGRAGVVQEHHLARISLGGQRGQHRQNRGDAAAAADQHQLLRPLLGQPEYPRRGREVHDHAAPGVPMQILRHQAVRMRLHRQCQGAPRTGLGIDRRIAPGVLDAVDQHSDLYELTRFMSGPLPGRAQREGDRAGDRPIHSDDLGAHIAHCQRRAHQLQVTVERMRRGQCLDQIEQSHHADLPKPSSEWSRATNFSAHLYTEQVCLAVPQ